MTDIDSVLSKDSSNYRFHGVQGATLHRLINQAEDGIIRLWGTDHDDRVSGDDGDWEEAEYVQGAGYLYVTDIRNLELSYTDFATDGGLVLVLEKQVENFFEEEINSQEIIIKVQDWKVVGGLRANFNEDWEMTSEEAFSLEEILREEF